MKKVYFLFAMMVTALCFSFDASAQETRQLNLSSNGILSLAEQDQPDGRFQFDVSHMEFANNQEMSAFFSQRSTEDYMMRAAPDNNIVYVIIRGDNHPEWSVQDWNNHLANKLAEQPIVKD